MNMEYNTSNFSTDSLDKDGFHSPLTTSFSPPSQSKRKEDRSLQLEPNSPVSTPFRLVEQSVDLLRDVGSMLGPQAALELHRYVQKDQFKEIYSEHEANYLSLVSEFEAKAKSANAKEREIALQSLREGSSQLLQHPELKTTDNNVLVKELKALLASLPAHKS